MCVHPIAITIRAVAIAIALMGLALPAFAENVCDPSVHCADTTSNVEFKACIGGLAGKQQSEMDRLYQNARDQLIDSTASYDYYQEILNGLEEAQAKWSEFRESQCRAEFSFAGGGTAGGGYYSECLCVVTYHRTLDLKRVVDQYLQ